MTRAPATAKLNLALVVGRAHDGRHELTTVYQRLDLVDRVAVAPAPRLRVSGFPEDTLVRNALEGLAAAAGVPPRWEARLTKRIPVAAGLGGGSSDAATALRLANKTLDEPLVAEELCALAAKLGSGAVYAEFDQREGPKGYRTRRAALKRALREAKRARDLARLPTNDLASSPLAADLLAEGAFRADVTGAGPVVYGLFQHLEAARAARAAFKGRGRTWLTAPAWYG